MDGGARHFSSAQEEIEHWKKQALDYKQNLEEAQEELEEFQINSRELESELEAQLEQADSKNRELLAANQRMQMELESLREKFEQHQSSAHKRTTELEDELAVVKSYKDELQRYIRELEQSNDDLERAKRATVTSLEDFESRLNLAIERNAFLESELDEKETLVITVQRLKDEARDLRQEVEVSQKHKDPRSPTTPEKIHKELEPPPKVDTSVQDSNKLAEEYGHYPVSTTPASKNAIINHAGGGTPLTPSARISALNIVGDLLRKVGALETKLASCKNFVNHQQPRSGKSGASGSPLNSPRAKRLHRGTTLPVTGDASAVSDSQFSVPSQHQQGYVKVTI